MLAGRLVPFLRMADKEAYVLRCLRESIGISIVFLLSHKRAHAEKGLIQPLAESKNRFRGTFSYYIQKSFLQTKLFDVLQS